MTNYWVPQDDVGSGDVVGPGSSTDNAVAVFDGTTGKLLKNRGVLISNTNSISGVVNLSMAKAITFLGTNSVSAGAYSVQVDDTTTSLHLNTVAGTGVVLSVGGVEAFKAEYDGVSIWKFSDAGVRLRDSSGVEYITFGGFTSPWNFGSNIGSVNFNQKIVIDAGGIDHNLGDIGFFGAAQVGQQISGANLTNNVTVGGSNNVIADFSVTVGVDIVNAASQSDVNTALTAIRNDIYQIARTLKITHDSNRTYGFLT